MILSETINKLLRDVVDLLLVSPGYTIKSRQKDAPRPVNAYADITLITDTGVGLEQFTYSSNGFENHINITSESMREIMMSINFYRNNSMDNARRIHSGITRESVRSLLNAGNLGLIRRSEVRELSEPLENGWEERSQLDIFLSAVGTDVDIVSSIGSVDIACEFQARGLIYNFNVEV
tara:strand:- start:13945 stop:14478 length:534 start_codon:yes stop_codon:yes gene_type:complete